MDEEEGEVNGIDERQHAAHAAREAVGDAEDDVAEIVDVARLAPPAADEQVALGGLDDCRRQLV